MRWHEPKGAVNSDDPRRADSTDGLAAGARRRDPAHADAHGDGGSRVERGARMSSVAHVVERAGVSRRTF